MARITPLSPMMWRALVKIGYGRTCDFRSSNGLANRNLIESDGYGWYVPTAHGRLTLSVVRAALHQFELIHGAAANDHLAMALAAMAVAERYGVPSK